MEISDYELEEIFGYKHRDGSKNITHYITRQEYIQIKGLGTSTGVNKLIVRNEVIFERPLEEKI